MKIQFLKENPASILIVIFIFIYVQFYPGLVSIDSIIQLTQAHSQNYTDWHPPLSSYVLSKIGTFLPVVPAMVCLQVLFFCFGTFLFYRAWRNQLSTWGAFLLLLMPLFPYFFNFMGVLWKDVQFAACFFLAVALTEFSFSQFKNKVYFVFTILICIALVSFAQVIRGNGFFLSPFILTYILISTFDKLNIKTWKVAPFLFGFLIAAGIFIGNQVFIYQVLDTKKTYQAQYIMMFDLVGMSHYANADLLPTNIVKSKDCPNSEVYKRYDSRVGDLLFADYVNPTGPCQLVWYTEVEPFQVLRHQWIQSIRNEPWSYFQHRLSYFIKFLQLNKWESEEPYYTFSAPNQFGIVYDPGVIRWTIWRIYFVFRNMPLFFNWFYLAAIFFMLGYTARKNREVVPIPILLGGLTYMSMYFFIGFGPFFRYIYVVPILLTPFVIKFLSHKKRLH